ncbi:MAG: hypothetical protein JXR82_10420 [Marinifilaceae bacterium]|nr:hypothetical protein [Marinifilaceae bacterium]
MKYALIALLVMIVFSVEAQQKDTLLFLIDRKLDIVDFRIEKRFYETESFVIAVDCEYFGENNDFAKAVFDELLEDFRNKIAVKEPKITIAKCNIPKYDTLNVEWLSEQKSLQGIMERVGFYNLDKYYYVVFKEDLNDLTKDSVTLHQCILRFAESED